MKRLFIIILMILGCLNAALAYDNITGKAITVVDGTTVEVQTADKQVYSVRLFGIDSPELTQEYGDDAKKLLEKLVLGKNVTVKIVGKDRWGRYLGELMIDGKVDPRIELLKQGLTWTSEKNNSPDLDEYRAKAQQRGKGLWKQTDPTPPWIYRRQQSMQQPKSI